MSTPNIRYVVAGDEGGLGEAVNSDFMEWRWPHSFNTPVWIAETIEDALQNTVDQHHGNPKLYCLEVVDRNYEAVEAIGEWANWDQVRDGIDSAIEHLKLF